MKHSLFILWLILLSTSVQASKFTDKLFEFTDSAKEHTRELTDLTIKSIQKTKEKTSDAYQDYHRRKALDAERERREKKRVSKAVNYYEEQMRKKNIPKTGVKYADPCTSSQATCKTDSLNKKWCWFPGTSKSLCSAPVRKSLSSGIRKIKSKVSLRGALKKKRDECREKVYEEWARNGGGNQEFASFSLTAALKAQCN